MNELKWIAQFVYKQTGKSLEELQSSNRKVDLVFARMLLCALANKKGHSCTNVGNFLNRDHTTILYLLKKAKNNETIKVIIEKFLSLPENNDNIPAINNISKQNLWKYGRIYELWGGKCPICGFDSVVEVHHLIPRSLGGTDEPNNLILLCPNHHTLADRGMIFINNLKELINGVINNYS